MSLPNLSSSTESPASALAINHDTEKKNSAASGFFVDRRSSQPAGRDRPERRQFGSFHAELSEAGRELALAIDQYKIEHHRRYLTCDEILRVLNRLGYTRQDQGIT